MPQIAPIAWVVMAFLIFSLLLVVKSKMFWSGDLSLPKIESVPTPTADWPFL